MAVESGKVSGAPNAGGHSYRPVAVSADGKVVVSECEDGGLKVWHVRADLGGGPLRVTASRSAASR